MKLAKNLRRPSENEKEKVVGFGFVTIDGKRLYTLDFMLVAFAAFQEESDDVGEEFHVVMPFLYRNETGNVVVPPFDVVMQAVAKNNAALCYFPLTARYWNDNDLTNEACAYT